LGTRLYHAVNVFVAHHAWLGRLMASIESWSVPLLAAATVSLWLLDRPGRRPRRKLAAATALASAAMALLANRAFAAIWHRDRPFLDHPSAHVWGSRPHDASFPSDHVSAVRDRAGGPARRSVRGALFLAAAVVIATSRVLVGVHYPADVGAGIVVGDAAALLVRTLARRPLALAARAVERLTEGVLAPIWRHVPERGR
jgi:membrane-associated phospholipid phosphatase